jgi:hypothetical protein
MKRVALILLAVLAFSTAWAQHQKVVRGVAINLAVVSAAELKPFPEESGHDGRLPSGSHHVMVSLSDAKSGAHIEAAKVFVELKDPKGNMQKKDLVLGRTANIPDYSEIFIFGYSGEYRIRVTVQPKQGKPIRAAFVWKHYV